MQTYVTGSETTNFRHVEFKLAEFSRMAASSAAPFLATAQSYHDPRFGAVANYLKTNPAIPVDVRDEAAKYSRDLVFSFTSYRSKIIRGQSHGALDSSRLARLASPGIAPREFDRLAASAYRRREHVQAQTNNPRLAIVADMNNDIRSCNLQYMKVLGRLAYIVAEAAKLSGIETALYGSRGFTGYKQNEPVAQAMAAALGLHDCSKRPHVVFTAKDWANDMTGSEYAVFTDAIPGTKIVSPLPLFTAIHATTGSANGMGSDCGAGGIEFARSQGANLVIAFGNFHASEKADLTFAPSDSVETVVRGIVAALGNREAA